MWVQVGDNNNSNNNNNSARTRRKRALHTLSTLGKWSLADVLVVCVMVGVLHLDWTVLPDQIKQGIVEQVPLLLQLAGELTTSNDICDALLHMNCTDPPNSWTHAKC
jgi:hypothetical protein